MIEVIIMNYLDSHLHVPSFLEYPDKPIRQFILMEKTGSSKSNYVLSSTFAFQSYSESLSEAAKLNEKLKEAVESLIILDEVSSVKLNSDYNFTDTEKKQYRYQAVFDITHY